MEKNRVSDFKKYLENLTTDENKMLDELLKNIKQRCLLSKRDNYQIRNDFIKALLYYNSIGFNFSEAIKLIDPINLGGFYARTARNWYSLDDSAKIYPMSMEHGKMAIFRLSAYFKEEIVPELLQLALTFTIKRFPTFATTVKKGVFWHYLDTIKGRFCIYREMEEPLRQIKVSRSGTPTFRVLYFKNRVSVEFFHILTDGKGGMVFLKALIAEYLRLTGVKIDDYTDVWNINETPNISEIRNEFSHVEHSKNTSGLINKRALQMNGKLTGIRPNQIIHFKMNSFDLKQAAKKYNVTVTAFVLSMMFIAIKAAIDSMSGDVSIQVPINMRKFYDSNTVRNFTMYFGAMVDIEEITTIEELSSNINSQLQAKANKEKMSEMVTAANKLVTSIRFVPTVIKLPFAKRLHGYLGDQAFTSTLSNLGVVNMPDIFKKHILSMDFVLGTAPNNRAICGLVTFNNISTLSVSKMTKDPTFEEKIYELILKEGIEVSLEGSDLYES